MQARVTHFPRHIESQALRDPEGKSEAMKAQERLDKRRSGGSGGGGSSVMNESEPPGETKEEREKRVRREKRRREEIAREFREEG